MLFDVDSNISISTVHPSTACRSSQLNMATRNFNEIHVPVKKRMLHFCHSWSKDGLEEGLYWDLSEYKVKKTCKVKMNWLKFLIINNNEL